MKSNYQKARRYASKCGYELDVVHDAYIKWWEKTGRNLFLEKEHTVIKVVKNNILNLQQKSRYVVDGEHRTRTFVGFGGIYGGEYNEPSIAGNQEQALALKTTIEAGHRLRGTARTVFLWLERGFGPVDIAEIEGISQQLVRYHQKRFKLMLN